MSDRTFCGGGRLVVLLLRRLHSPYPIYQHPISMRRPAYPYAKKFSNGFLQSLSDTFDRPTVGYASNLGGYYRWAKVSRDYYLKTIARMKHQGWIAEVKTSRKTGGKKFLKLTKKGRMRALLGKLQTIAKPNRRTWNGTWWLAIFDIPEKEGGRQRTQLRRALLQAGFSGLQKSVYIYPHAIPEELIGYLKISRLDRFVRFLHVDRADNPRDLEKRCHL